MLPIPIPPSPNKREILSATRCSMVTKFKLKPKNYKKEIIFSQIREYIIFEALKDSRRKNQDTCSPINQV